jgi:RNA polymerase sigma-70 factor (ECF subfamily)
MTRYARGDDVSFAELHETLAPRLQRFLLHRTRDRIATQDLLQQILLRIHTARAQFRPGTAVFPWAFAIARSMLIDSVRRSKTRLRHECSIVPNEEPASEMEPEGRFEAITMINKVRTILAGLPERQRLAFELLDVEGRSLSEVAEMLGTTKTAAKIRAHRARTALRAAMLEAEGTRTDA